MKKAIVMIPAIIWAGIVLASPFNLEMTESLRWKGQYYDLAIQDDMLFLAGKLGVEIYTLEGSGTPERIGGFQTMGLANGVALNLPLVYVGDVYGFSIWDISDIDRPVRRSGIRTDSETGYQERLYYRDGLVYVAAYTSGIQVFDVSDPDHPYLAGQAPSNAYAWDMVLTEDAAYIMDFFSMSIMDIRRPRFPVNRVNVDAMFANGAAVRNDTLFLGYVDGLRIMDISDPFNPVDISDIGPTGGGTAETVALKDNAAFVGHGSYVEIYDISDLTDPVQIAYFYPPGHPRKLTVYGDRLYTVLDDNGFLVTDISDPANPVTVEHVDPSIWGTRNDVHYDAGYMYLSDWNRGLVIYEAQGTEPLAELTTYAAPGSLRDFEFRSDTAYLVCQSEIQILDITDRTAPIFLGRFQTTGSPQNVHIDGNRMYLCDLYGLYILDISDPEQIQRLGAEWLAKEGNPYDVFTRGGYAFVANGWKGMKVVDIADETDPDTVLTWPGDNSKSYVAVRERNGLLYFLDPGRGLDVLDVSDPINPVQVAEIGFDGLAVNDFVMQGTLLALAAGEDGVFLWDIKNINAPVLMARANTPGDALGIDFNDDRVFVADEFNLAVFDRLAFKADSTVPAVQITAPAAMERITLKTISVRGTASDAASGIRRVEISTDGGGSWRGVYGQERWSALIAGFETGPVSIRARAVDWSGNVGPETEDTWVYFDPPIPGILAAGFEDTTVNAGRSSSIIVSAVIRDSWDPVYLKDAVLYLNGELLESSLIDITTTGDIRYYRLEYTDTFETSGIAEYSIVFRDIYNNVSVRWPEIPVKW